MENSVDPDQMPHSVASDQGLHCLFGPVCPNTKVKYGMYAISIVMNLYLHLDEIVFRFG